MSLYYYVKGNKVDTDWTINLKFFIYIKKTYLELVSLRNSFAVFLSNQQQTKISMFYEQNKLGIDFWKILKMETFCKDFTL